MIAWTINAAYTEATRVADSLVGGIPVTSGRHGGCRLRFVPEGYLYIATGDSAAGTVPQDLTSLGGKVLRVDASTGAGAPANPFAPSPVSTYGYRNVQGLALRPGTSQMWLVENGPSTDDEINLPIAGRNYGWDPVPGYNEGVPTLAARGAIFLEGAQWGVWEGRLAVATLKDSKLRLFEFTPDGTFVSQVVVAELDGAFGRLRAPMLDPDGVLYMTTSNGDGADRILRITRNEAPVVIRDAAGNVAEDLTRYTEVPPGGGGGGHARQVVLKHRWTGTGTSTLSRFVGFRSRLLSGSLRSIGHQGASIAINLKGTDLLLVNPECHHLA